MTYPAQGEVVQVRPDPRCHVAGQKKALVEPSFSQSIRVKRHGHDEQAVVSSQPGFSVGGEERSEGSGEMALLRVLEVVDGGHQRALVEVRGTGDVVVRPLFKTGFAGVIFAASHGEGPSAQRAERGGHLFKSVEAIAAEADLFALMGRPVLPDEGLAYATPGRIDKIN